MKWNMYQDQENRAYSSILTALFPEQTKTLPRILVWSIIFLADLIIVAAAAFHLGPVRSNYKLGSILFIAVVIGLFWLQGFLWGLVSKLFRHRKEHDNETL